MNGAGLNLLGIQPRVIIIDRTSILNIMTVPRLWVFGIKCVRFTYRSSRDSVKPTKRVGERENKFWKDYVTSPQGY